MESEPTDEPKMALDDESLSFLAETTCNICYAEFLDPEDLDIHISQVHANTAPSTKYCQFCATTYTDLEDYALHIRDAHITEMRCCKFCTKVFTNSEKHRKHVKKHHSATKKHACSQCPMLFDSLWKLEGHEYNNHYNDDDGVILKDCYSQLSSIFNIKALTVLKSLGNDTIYICAMCDHCTVDIESYVKHLQEKNCRSLTCEKCSNVYKKKGGLARHLKTHKECFLCFEVEDKVVICSKCQEEVLDVNLKKHEKTCKVLKCSKCVYSFKTMVELSEHHAKDHPLSVEVKVCKFCCREFVGTVAMQKHIDRAHKEEFHLYKYKCVYCNGIFKHPRKLFGHYFMKHKDLEPYTCKICNLKFRLRKRFTLHIKLDHNSIGFVEFDKRYHVFFTDKKSEQPFNPMCVLPEEYLKVPKILNVYSEACVNENSDILSMTETDGNQTELDMKTPLENNYEKRPKRKVRYNPKRNTRKGNTIDFMFAHSSDEEPLSYLKERVKKKASLPKAKGNLSRRTAKIAKRKKQFTCKTCNKYCYTFQNYHNHMSLHSKRDEKKCIKCSKMFRSKNDLQKHIKTDHAKSKLTETLKTLLEKRKGDVNINKTKSIRDMTTSEKFQATIKKVKVDNFNTTAKIMPIPSSGISVQKFIENFTPDLSESKDTKMEHCVTIQRFDNPFYRAPVIKLTKFKPVPVAQSCSKLAMPIKYKPTFEEKVQISMRIVQQPVLMSPSMAQKEYNDPDYNDYYEDMDMSEQYRNDSIPEVAQEVLLEGTEEPPKTKPIPHKIILPKLPELGKSCKKIHIAHMLPTAPFFKIITVKDGVQKQIVEKEEPKPSEDVLKLPDGTKLVTANPLAHLLGDADIEKVLQNNTNKYYKPRVRNFKGLLAKALQDIDSKVYKKKPKKESSVVSMSVKQ